MNRHICKEKEKVGEGTYSIHFYISISVIVAFFFFFLRGNVDIFSLEVEMKILALHDFWEEAFILQEEENCKKPLSNSTYLA